MSGRPTRTSGLHKTSAASLDCAAAFQAIALDCVAAMKAQHSSACAGDAEAVHQIRVAITRLRAAVAFFAPIVVDAEWLRLKKEIAWLNGSLGAARDSDVLVEYARRKRYRSWAEHIIRQVDQCQTRDHRRLVRSLRSVRTQRLISAVADWIRQGAWLARCKRNKEAEALQFYCARELNRWHERLIRKGRRLKALGASRRHRLRIKVKRFRYMLEGLTGIVALWSRGELLHLHRPAKRLQRALGDLRDLKRFAGLASGLRQAESRKRSKAYPPDYRRRREKLVGVAVASYRELSHARAC
ncbi:CHAD domain-containing protein [Bradyrhizobium australiense]|uniref:CHAD domain-containing protein n=1 Tax=Bradyrhizobium australiense TaxID=2721161 RepID=A0A7Y4GW78_9BRAD|nr:CHAD domain-containing protein [Bradyrhizobium australiense]NOJ43056.1 CHAD domain-containing protein [Bradyrhizobium australiense]